MFKNILVPLDGSKLAESALQPAEKIATLLKSKITLLHVVEKDAPQTVHNDSHLTNMQQAEDYLAMVAAHLQPGCPDVVTHVHTSLEKDVARSIISHAKNEFNPDLIILCSHGESGLRQKVFGNIAQQVLSGGKTPILLLSQTQTGAPASPAPEFSVKRILVPLDEHSEHDGSIQSAIEMARLFSAELYLLTVIPTLATLTGRDAAVSHLLPITASTLLDLIEEETAEHLSSHVQEFNTAGIKSQAEVVRGDPAELISARASSTSCDLILLGTHRSAGLKAFWSRSVTPAVINKTHIPIMMIPL